MQNIKNPVVITVIIVIQFLVVGLKYLCISSPEKLFWLGINFQNTYIWSVNCLNGLFCVHNL